MASGSSRVHNKVAVIDDLRVRVHIGREIDFLVLFVSQRRLTNSPRFAHDGLLLFAGRVVGTSASEDHGKCAVGHLPASRDIWAPDLLTRDEIKGCTWSCQP